MRRIFKYTLIDDDVLVMSSPIFLSVQYQGDVLCLWAMIDDMAGPEQFRVRIFGTGQPINDDDLMNLQYRGTVQRGAYVWHVFIGKI
jgi:hypothetical protein